MSPRRDVSMTPEEIERFLDGPLVAVLSTIGRDGYPHAAAMWYVKRDDELRMWTYAKSQKARNAMRDPRAAFLAEDGEAYTELRGVLVKGRLQVVNDFDSISAIGRLLYDRYTLPRTGIPVEDGPIAEIERQARKRVGLILPLADVASWDHRRLA